MNKNKNIAFCERLVTEVRSAIMESPLRPRVPLPRFYRVKGKYLIRVNINRRVYSACLGAKLDEEAMLRGLQELLKLVGDRVQASSSPRARDSHKGLSALTALVALFSVAR